MIFSVKFEDYWPLHSDLESRIDFNQIFVFNASIA